MVKGKRNESIISVYDEISESQNTYDQSNGKIVDLDDILLTLTIPVANVDCMPNPSKLKFNSIGFCGPFGCN